VIGGGPAGSTVARLLALRGFSVALRHRPAAKHSLAETLPPSIRNVFHLLGIQRQIDAAGFYRTTGNTSWWRSSRKQEENYSGTTGYQVLRADFDRLLLRLAEEAGVRITSNPESQARYTLDCSGRAGVLARKLRVPQEGFHTLALSAIWRGPCKDVDPTHTLVEAYRGGWVWAIPLAADRRYVTVMTERGRKYAQELRQTRAIRKLLAGCVPEGQPWGCDASLYFARRYATRLYTNEDSLLVGDAGSFADPIASFGVKKALTSAWVAAAAVTTCLRHPERSALALEYFEQRERQTYADHMRQAAAHYAQGAVRFPTPFWTARAQFHDPAPKFRAALNRLRAAPELSLHLGEGVRFEPRPALQGEEIALRPALTAPGLAPGQEFYYGVNLATLARIAETHHQLPALYDDYNRCEPPATLAAFLTALSFLMAVRVLV